MLLQRAPLQFGEIGHGGIVSRGENGERMHFELQGHRGARGLKTENTLPAFEVAFDLGVTSVETDLHLTKDGVPVIVHDPHVGARAIAEMTNVEVSRLRVQLNQIRFPKQDAEPTPLAVLFAKERGVDPFAIPTLEMLFAFATAYSGELGQRAGKTEAQRGAAASIRLDLEIKRVPFRAEYIGGPIEEKVCELINAAGVRARTRVRSFDHRSLQCVRELDSNLETAVLVAENTPVAPAEMTRAAGASIYCPHFTFIDGSLVEQLHDAGFRVLPWTVNEPADWTRLIDMGVDGITTDYPDRLAAFIDTKR
jgi:glycerophosphoryl diester phosphodiesterase